MLIFWISEVLPPCTIKNAKFHILDTMWKSFFFQLRPSTTHIRTYYIIYITYMKTGGNFGWLSKMTIIAGCRFESLPLKMMFWQKKSWADLISCVYIFIILQKLDMPKTSYIDIYTHKSHQRYDGRSLNFESKVWILEKLIIKVLLRVTF